jgi:hypothetical protein
MIQYHSRGRRGLRGFGYSSDDAAADLAYLDIFTGNVAPIVGLSVASGAQPTAPGDPLATGLPNGISWQNLTSGTLSPAQVALLQAQGQAGIQQVYNNAVTYYGADSPAAQAVAAILPAQIQGVVDDLNALNPQPATDPLLNATGIAWYWWALGALGVFLALEYER